MNYILSEDEYTDLVRHSHQVEVVEAELSLTKQANLQLQSNYAELRLKYNNLLVHNVTSCNESLKRHRY